MEPVDHVRIIFGNPCVFIVETSTGTIIGSAITQLRSGGSAFANQLANQLLRAALELNEIRDFDTPDPTIEPPDYFRGIGDRPG